MIKLGWGDPRIIGLLLVFAVLIGAFARPEAAGHDRLALQHGRTRTDRRAGLGGELCGDRPRPGDHGTTVLTEAGEGKGADAFIDGLEAAFRLDALLALGGFLISVLLIGGRAHLPSCATAGHSPRGHGP